ncbi:MAG: DUF4097 family beta strand repeat-containing protein [Elusimicrobiales bacterium]|jgi:hypothetical protein
MRKLFHCVLFIPAMICAPLSGVQALEDDWKTFPAAGLSGMEIYTEAGSISVEVSSDPAVGVEITGNDPRKCRLTVKPKGKKLILRAEQIGRSYFLPDNNCSASFAVSAPAALALNAVAGSGDVRVLGRSAAVAVESGTGEISVRSVTGDFKAATGSGGITGDVCARSVRVAGGAGSVDLTGLCGSASVWTGAGKVVMQWDRVPLSGKARVVTGSGSITLTFPRKAGLQVKLESAVNAVKNEFKDKGKFAVSAESGAGRISVLKAAK